MKKLYFITAAVAIAILAAFNVTILGNKHFHNINLKHVESMAGAGEFIPGDPRELKTFQCDDGIHYYDQCSFSDDGPGCRDVEETICPIGSEDTDKEGNEICMETGHLDDPCYRCGWNVSDDVVDYNHSIYVSYIGETPIYNCSKCNKTQSSLFPVTGCPIR